MAVAYRSSSTSGSGDSFSSTTTTPVPAGSAAGDIALLAIEQWDPSVNPTITWPTGFTQIVAAVDGAEKLKIAWKRLAGADTGNYIATHSSTIWNLGHCILITGGLAVGDPIEATNTNSSAGASYPSTTVTTVTEPFLAHILARTSSSTTTPPTGYTEVQDTAVLSTEYRIPAATGVQTASGGTISAGMVKIAALVAVKPAAASGTDVTPADAAHGHTADQPTITQTHVLTTADAAHPHTADAPALTQVHVLAVDSASHGHAAESPTVDQSHVVTPDDAGHAHTAGQPTVSQVHALTVDDASHAHVAAQPALTSEGDLAPADALHGHTADQPSITQAHVITPADAAHAHAAGSPTVVEPEAVLVNLDFVALAPVFAHGAVTVETITRTAVDPVMVTRAALTPETVDRTAGEPALGHGDVDTQLGHGDVDTRLGHGAAGEPQT